ncbi:MAG: flagellar basal-body MS-ring/collar protein FliF [Proteobacteria bacterium]|nr:flagellar basal-body MS-ring/collar protein FliF [Pseudomonadota bacterium]
MAAVEADVLAGRFDARPAGEGGGVTVTTSSEARGLAVQDGTDAAAPSGMVARFLAQPAVKTAAPFVTIGLVLMLAMAAFLTLSASPLRALYPEMADADKDLAQQALSKSGINVKLDPVTGSLQVSQKEFHEARIVLATAGLPRQVSTGLSGLKNGMPLGTSQFMEQMRYNASVEEELAQSIRRINTVQDARVHLALPHQSAFVRDRTEPKASVIVTPYSGRTLSEGQVQAIVHVVSSSIPYLNPAGVSVVDQFGRLLTESGDSKDSNNKQMALRQKMETDYSERVVQLLAPMFGAANVRAQVNLDMDFSIVEQTFENYDPDGKGLRVRSEQSKQIKTTDEKAMGTPGSLSNAPPDPTTPVAGANAPAAGAAPAGEPVLRDTENTQARNYEIDKTIKYVVDPSPHIKRVSVAVALNDAIAAPGDAAPTAKPLSEEEVARLTNLVKGAIGFDEKRGDQVNLMSTSFEAPVAQAALPIWQQPQYIDLAKYGLVAVAIALLALLVIRPVVNRLTYVATTPGPDELRRLMSAQGGVAGAVDADGVVGGARPEVEEEALELREGETLEQLKSRMKPKKKAGISAEMLDTANSYDDKVTVVRMLVSQDARRVALVLKNLIAREIN